jgi:replication factor C subunit 3/5
MLSEEVCISFFVFIAMREFERRADALITVIEKYTKNVRFCIICNYVSKIIPAIQSRCTRFRFAPLQESQVSARLGEIIQGEGIQVTQEGQKALVKLSQGDMRRALNILQATHAAYSLITEESIYTCTGSPLPADIEQIAQWCFGSDFADAYSSTFLCSSDEYNLIRE